MSKHKNYNIDEIKKLYMSTSLSINQIARETNISTSMVRYYIKKLNMVRPDYLIKQEIEQTIQRRCATRLAKNNGQYFSNESINQAKQTRLAKNNGQYFSEKTNQKRIQTNLEKYGVINVFQDKNIQNNAKQTKLLKYGNENYNNREQAVKTRLGNNNGIYNTDIINSKTQETNKLKYGKPYYTQTIEYKSKSKNTRLTKNNGQYFSEKTKLILSEKAKQNYTLSNSKRLLQIKNKNSNFSRCFYTNKKLLDILLEPKTNFKQYIQELPIQNRNFAYIENDLDISYSSLLNYAHTYKFKDMLSNNRSHFQQSVIEFIKSLNVNYIENNRTIIKPLEIDIYIPEYKVGIECNGNYWHSKKQIDKNYHYNKSKLCDDQNIRLIHIFEYEWENERQRPILKNIIKNALGINDIKIYARKCNITIKKSKDMREFFDQNNIQGFRGGKFAICLEYQNEIIMSYMMGSAFFGKGKYEWEVIRGATKLGYTVVGGASKIFNYFIKTYNPKNCVYYIDFNYFNGNSLKNLPNMRFIKTQISFKNYWVKDRVVKNREPKRNSLIKELYKTGEVLQLYNAGTKVYVWENNI